MPTMAQENTFILYVRAFSKDTGTHTASELEVVFGI